MFLSALNLCAKIQLDLIILLLVPFFVIVI